ncbi:peroxiredoxin-like family protein [Streptomyces microflavus]|uniref:peroxiredoxin-like family protein n=1 Tax=Streptomyces microflavus TaxID=1919 RepID=UPI0033ED340A
MGLNTALRAFYASRQTDIPEHIREIMERSGRELAASGAAEQALKVGDTAPDFTLPSAAGESIGLTGLLKSGPVVLTFYRGAWCPYCNLALRHLQQHVGAMSERGARLVAVSPQIADESLSITQKHHLTFDVLSDIGSSTAKRYGLAFDLTDELASVYEAFGMDLQRVNGGHAHTLPLPATYVIDRDSTIRWAFVDSDYTTRAEPTDIIAALDTLPAAPGR